MTATTLEPVLIEDLDFDPACQTKECIAGRPAATFIGFASCGCSRLMCTPCVQAVKRLIDVCRKIGIGMKCNICDRGVDLDTVRWVPLP